MDFGSGVFLFRLFKTLRSSALLSLLSALMRNQMDLFLSLREQTGKESRFCRTRLRSTSSFPRWLFRGSCADAASPCPAKAHTGFFCGPASSRVW